MLSARLDICLSLMANFECQLCLQYQLPAHRYLSWGTSVMAQVPVFLPTFVDHLNNEGETGDLPHYFSISKKTNNKCIF